MKREITIDLHEVSFIGAVVSIFLLIFLTLVLWASVHYPDVMLTGDPHTYADVQNHISVLAFLATTASVSLIGLWKVEL